MKTLSSIFFAIAAIALAFIYGNNINTSTTIEFMLSSLTRLSARINSLTSQTFTTNASTAMSSATPNTFRDLPLIPDRDALTMTKPRTTRLDFLAKEVSEGVGARVRRSIGTPKLRNLSPFLMLDHFSTTGGGFPDHFHYGMSTITLLLRGMVDHEDFLGNKGVLEAGDLQFMTAGRGIGHAEMPRESADGHPVGMQLWVDLPKEFKECEPRYRDLKAREIPKAVSDDGKVNVRVISGLSYGVESLKELAETPVWFLEFNVQPGGHVKQALPAGWNAFAYLLSGQIIVSDNGSSRTVEQYHNVVFEQDGDSVDISVNPCAESAAQFVLIAGQPLDQPVVQHGPFVATSMEKIREVMMDSWTQSNGFERAKGWQSEIGRPMLQG